MALNFKPSLQPVNQEDNGVISTTAAIPQAQNVEVIEPETFNIALTKSQLQEQIINSDEIDKLTSQINVNDPNSIVKFGGPVAEEISKASDQVLKSMNINQVNDTGKLMTNLAAIMN